MVTAQEILQKKVSFYRHCGDNIPVSKNIYEVLDTFRGVLYKDRIEQLRDCGAEEYSIQKRQLPAVTFCGVFENGRTKDHLKCSNNLIIIDIDKVSVDELSRIKAIFQSDEYVFSFWESPSGHGIKALILLDFQHNIVDIHSSHKYAFQQIAEYLKEAYSIYLDSSGSDITRLCFVSYDPTLTLKSQVKCFVVDNCKIIEEKSTKRVKLTGSTQKKSKNIISVTFDKRHKNSTNKNKSNHRIEISRIIKYLKNNNLSITNSYDEWFRVGYAIANSFNSDLGVKYYLQLCELDGSKHSEYESLKMLAYCYDNSKGEISFATIRHYAESKGYHKRQSGGEGST